ncbi:MAG: nucleotidyltransferase domain-containing protein [Magnetococcus sp. XQGC-1]
MRIHDHLEVADEPLQGWCRRWGVTELALFGSALGSAFSETSDVDLLVEFGGGAPLGLIAMARMQGELAQLFARPVDLVPKRWLKPAIRDTILAQARVFYVAHAA